MLKANKTSIWISIAVIIALFIIYFFSQLEGFYFQGSLREPISNTTTATANGNCESAVPTIKMLSRHEETFLPETPFELYSFSISAPQHCSIDVFQLGTLRVETSMDGDTKTLYDFELYQYDKTGKKNLVSDNQKLYAYPVFNEGQYSGEGVKIENLFQWSMYSIFPNHLHDPDKDGKSIFDLAMILPTEDIITIEGGETVKFQLMATAEQADPTDYIKVTMLKDSKAYYGALRHFIIELNQGAILLLRNRYLSTEYRTPFRPSMIWSNKTESPHWAGSTDWHGSYSAKFDVQSRNIQSGTKENIFVEEGDIPYAYFSAINTGRPRIKLSTGSNNLLNFDLYAKNDNLQLKTIFFWVKEFANVEVTAYQLASKDGNIKLYPKIISNASGWKSLEFEIDQEIIVGKNDSLEFVLSAQVSNSDGDLAVNFAGAQGISTGLKPNINVGYMPPYPASVADGKKQGAINIIDSKLPNSTLVSGQQDILKFKLSAENEDIILHHIDIAVHVSSYDDIALEPAVQLIDDLTGNTYPANIDANNDGQTFVDLSSNLITLQVGVPRTFRLVGNVTAEPNGPAAIYSFLDLLVYSQGTLSGADSWNFENAYEIFVEGRANQTMKSL